MNNIKPSKQEALTLKYEVLKDTLDLTINKCNPLYRTLTFHFMCVCVYAR